MTEETPNLSRFKYYDEDIEDIDIEEHDVSLAEEEDDVLNIGEVELWELPEVPEKVSISPGTTHVYVNKNNGQHVLSSRGKQNKYFLLERVNTRREVSQAFERAKIRRYITSIAMSLWIICIGVCLIRFLMTDEFALFGPPTLLTVPVCIIFRYYFNRD